MQKDENVIPHLFFSSLDFKMKKKKNHKNSFASTVRIFQPEFCHKNITEISQIKIHVHDTECVRWDKSVYFICDPGPEVSRPCPITTERCSLGSSGGESEK